MNDEHEASVLEDNLGSEGGGLDLKHVLLENEVLTPVLEEIVLDGATGRTIVIQTLNTCDFVTKTKRQTKIDKNQPHIFMDITTTK
jgi:hypothetical protein